MQILYMDESIVVIDKPAGMLVHRTNIASEVKEGFAVQVLRDLLGKHVFPVHRIDRPTSGLLMFALNSETASCLKEGFTHHKIQKEYHAVVRGYCEDKGKIDEPLTKENGNIQEALTRFETIGRAELPFQTSNFSTSRYSLVKVYPLTGRMHQIRRHFAKMRNYVIGDTTHGDLKQNRAFADFSGSSGLMLHASNLKFEHPHSQQLISIDSSLPDRFNNVLHHFT